MVSFTVDAPDYVDCLKEKLSVIPNIILNTDTDYKTQLNVNLASEGEQFEHFENLIADFILNKYKNRILYNITEKNYGCLAIEEKLQIQELARKRLEEEDDFSSIIRQSLKEYFETSKTINIDGFVRFRLGLYKKAVSDIVNECAEKYITEREYNEFIELLRCFVTLQESRVEVLHIETAPDQSYRFFDRWGADITKECFREIIDEDFAESVNINYDDMLISVLMVLAPKEIIWHNVELAENKELINTVKQIFEENVQFCTDGFYRK